MQQRFSFTYIQGVKYLTTEVTWSLTNENRNYNLSEQMLILNSQSCCTNDSAAPVDHLAICLAVFLRNILIKATDSQDWISRTSRPQKDQITEVITSTAICMRTLLLNLIGGHICNQEFWGQKDRKAKRNTEKLSFSVRKKIRLTVSDKVWKKNRMNVTYSRLRIVRIRRIFV